MLKVCHIISGDLWAGAEVMALQLLKGLKKYDDLDISIILLNYGRLAEELHVCGYDVYVFDEQILSFFNILGPLRKFLIDNSPDIIHTHRYKENILSYLVAKSIGGIKLISTQHGIPEIKGAQASVAQRIKMKFNFLLLAKQFNKLVCVSNDIKNAFLKNYFFNEQRLSVIHNGISILEPHNHATDDFTIGSAGRLFPIKDYCFMVDIASKVFEKTKAVKFFLAGDGPEKNKIRSLIDRYGLNDQFILSGHVDDIAEFYKGLDIYINTSLHEGIPMSILEAMSCGIPVVAMNVGGIHEIIYNGIDGYLIDKRDPGMVAEKCMDLLNNPELKRRMGKAAREKVIKSFSADNMVNRYYKLYLEIAGK